MGAPGGKSAPKPGEFICLDATPLITFAKIDEVAILQTWFPDAVTPTHVMEDEILEWKEKYPENQVFDGAAWPKVVPADTTADAAIIAQVGQFLASGKKNVGELHVMALTHRFRGTAIIDDATARKHAGSTKPPVKSVFMVSMIAAAAVSSLLTDDEAWELQCLVESTREPGYAIIRQEDEKEFRALLHFYRQIVKNKGWQEWPFCLHDRLLDVASLSARNHDLTTLYQKSKFGK